MRLRCRGALLALAGIMVMGLILVGCQKLGDQSKDLELSAQSTGKFEIPAVVETLWYKADHGGLKFMGTVTASKDYNSDTMLLIFTARSGWKFSQAYADWGWSLSAIPHDRYGQPDLWRFRYKANYRRPVSSDTFFVTVRDSGTIRNYVYDANCAVLESLSRCGSIVSREAWSGDSLWPSRNFCSNLARYFRKPTDTIPSPKPPHVPPHGKAILLPTDSVTVNFNFYTLKSYWDVTLSGIGDSGMVPYSVWDGHWLGWCCAETVGMPLGLTHKVILMTCYDPALPPDFQSPYWNYVNYIINNKPAGDTNAGPIQRAIWYFIGGDTSNFLKLPNPVNDPLAYALVLAALQNGRDFVPGTGQWEAVVLVHEAVSQFAFIEVDP